MRVRVIASRTADAVTVLNSINSAASGAVQTIEHNGINHTMGATEGQLSLSVSTAIDATGTYKVLAIEIDIDKP